MDNWPLATMNGKNREATAKCQIQADLCFKPLKEEDAAAMGINLYFNPYKFICAQIPGVGLDETFVFNGVNEANADLRLRIIGIVSYLRESLARVRYLQNNVMGEAKELYPNFYKDYYPKLANLEAGFAKHYQAVEEAIQKSGEDEFVGAFIHSFASGELVAVIKSYLKEWGRLKKSGAIEVSHELSERHTENLSGETIFQVMSLPVQWCKQIHEMAKNLAKLIVKTDAGRKGVVDLVKFAGNILNVLDLAR